jgi:hypothetical protein
MSYCVDIEKDTRNEIEIKIKSIFYLSCSIYNFFVILDKVEFKDDFIVFL